MKVFSRNKRNKTDYTDGSGSCQYVFLREIYPVVFLYAILTALIMLVGRAIYDENSVKTLVETPSLFVKSIGNIIGYFIIFVFLYTGSAVFMKRYMMFETKKKCEMSQWCNPRSCILIRLISSIVIFILSMTVLLAYYPGIFSYDMIVQTDQALGFLPIDRFHPPFHTMIWKLCLAIGHIWTENLTEVIESGITVYGILQGMLYAYVISGVIVLVVRMRIHPFIRGILIFSLCLNPVVLIFSIMPAKDAMFACFFLQMNKHWVMMIRDGSDQSKKLYVYLTVDIVLCCLLRNNAVYAMILMFVIILIGQGLQNKKMSIFWGLSILVFYMINGPIYAMLGFGGGDVREVLSLPLQQIAHVYVSEHQNMPEELVDEIDRFLPVDELNSVFNPRFADYVKERADKEEISCCFVDFLKLYCKLFFLYPDNYCNEFLALHVSAWYPLAQGIDPFSGRQYIETYISEYAKAQPVRKSKFPELYAVLEKIGDYSAFANTPGRFLFSMQAPIWGLILSVYFLWITNRKKYISICLPAIFLWVTYLAGPVTCLRYLFPMMLIQPLIWAVVFEKNRR